MIKNREKRTRKKSEVKLPTYKRKERTHIVKLHQVIFVGPLWESSVFLYNLPWFMKMKLRILK